MSTCPRCKGHLTETHRCPRRPGWIAAETALSAVAGAIVGLVAVALLDPRGNLTHIDGIALVAGGLAGAGIDRMLRSRGPGA